jgi:hypothetical protein
MDTALDSIDGFLYQPPHWEQKMNRVTQAYQIARRSLTQIELPTDHQDSVQNTYQKRSLKDVGFLLLTDHAYKFKINDNFSDSLK